MLRPLELACGAGWAHARVPGGGHWRKRRVPEVGAVEKVSRGGLLPGHWTGANSGGPRPQRGTWLELAGTLVSLQLPTGKGERRVRSHPTMPAVLALSHPMLCHPTHTASLAPVQTHLGFGIVAAAALDSGLGWLRL
ncbi:hypothetical protein DUNSADRAFT_2843 [Dunaliella salina]|uniref:Encoded protein n=1 Tax=Dunaliella salina TaxID=3046 RepID=A0ABQ7GV11_DUNSA|nr:hypothetical protein DUNSADRAFT_2843 [Dunaliella salina]|eukprot:KAF5838449.1 hypothetical protein DUNSADRAFT_2843 [Dunaliella salina]